MSYVDLGELLADSGDSDGESPSRKGNVNYKTRKINDRKTLTKLQVSKCKFLSLKGRNYVRGRHNQSVLLC